MDPHPSLRTESLRAEAQVAIDQPRRYLAQLCKHFQHKLPVTLAEHDGSIAFPCGACALQATADTLVLRLDAEDAVALARLEDVVARHLARFAFRTPPQIDWVAIP